MWSSGLTVCTIAGGRMHFGWKYCLWNISYCMVLYPTRSQYEMSSAWKSQLPSEVPCQQYRGIDFCKLIISVTYWNKDRLWKGSWSTEFKTGQQMVSCRMCDDDDFNKLTCLVHDDPLCKAGEMGCSMETRHEEQTHCLRLKWTIYPEWQNKALKWAIASDSKILT
jgi:hypothetical protein